MDFLILGDSIAIPRCIVFRVFVVHWFLRSFSDFGEKRSFCVVFLLLIILVVSGLGMDGSWMTRYIWNAKFFDGALVFSVLVV